MWLQLLLAFLIIYLWFKNQFSYFEKLDFPFVPGKIPFGSSSGLNSTEHSCEFLKREYERFKDQGPAFGVFFMARPMLIVTDPDLIRDIFSRHFESFHDHGFLANEDSDPLSANLFFKNGQKWKEMRRKLTPTFTSGRMKVMFPNVVRNADRMIDFLTNHPKINEPFEMKEIFASFTSEVIADVAFGLETDCLNNPNNEFRKYGKAVFEPSLWFRLRNLFVFSFEGLAKTFNLGFNSQEVIDFYTNTVRDNLAYREQNNVRRNDFFQLLIDIKNSEEGLEFNELVANSFVFFLAGFETISSAMMFTCYELALNQNIQKRLRGEITQVINNHEGRLDYDALSDMKYLDMVFNEILRKYPMVDMQFRRATKNFAIPGTKLIIPKGASIIVPVHALHNDERFWKNPDLYDPERFSPENARKIYLYSYIPFSEGPRQCLGLRFGQMQYKIGIVKLLLNFRINTCNKTIKEMKFVPSAAFQTPVGGMWLGLEKL